MDLDEFLKPLDPTTADIPEELVWHIAAGLEDANDIARRFGYTGANWKRLKNHGPFKLAVETLRAEFDTSGFTFKQKMRLMAGDLAERVFMSAKTQEATVGQVIEIFKTFAKLADLEPKVDKSVAVDAGTKFSVSINLGGQGSPATTIDITPQLLQAEPTDPTDIEENENTGDKV
jgi:hypothetical protein